MNTPIKDNLLNLVNNLPKIVEPEISETPYYQILYEYKPFHTQFVSYYRIEVVSNDKSNYITPEDWFNQIVIYQHVSKHILSDDISKSIVLDSNRYTLSQTSIIDYIASQNGMTKESETNISDESVSNIESQHASKHILSDDISKSIVLDSNRYTLSQTSIIDYIASQNGISKESETNVFDKTVSNIESQHVSKHILSDDISKLVTQNILSQMSIIDYIIASQNGISKESETNVFDKTVSNTESQHASKHILSDDVFNSIYFNLFDKILAIDSVKNNISLSSSSNIGLDDSYEIMVQ